jgi:hypothetical protein
MVEFIKESYLQMITTIDISVIKKFKVTFKTLVFLL